MAADQITKKRINPPVGLKLAAFGARCVTDLHSAN